MSQNKKQNPNPKPKGKHQKQGGPAQQPHQKQPGKQKAPRRQKKPKAPKANHGILVSRQYDAVDTNYLKCVFDPINAMPARIPSIFPTASSLFKFTDFYDWSFPANVVGRVNTSCFCPWNLVDATAVGTNIPGFVSFGFNSLNPVFDGTFQHRMRGFFGQDNDLNARATAYRVVATQVIVECPAPILNIQGTLTGALVPGVGNTNFPAGWFPTSSNLLQMPFGFSKEIKDLSDTNKFQITYFPLDAEDLIYHNVSGNPNAAMTYRNRIHINIDNLTQNLQLRFYVTSVIEYLPTPTYRLWANTAFGKDRPKSFDVLKTLVIENSKAAVSGYYDSVIDDLPPMMGPDQVIAHVTANRSKARHSKTGINIKGDPRNSFFM